MTPFLPLDCPDYDAINAEIIEYIKTKTNLLEYKKGSFYCNFITPLSEFLKAAPLLVKYLKSYNLYIQDCYFTLSWNKESLVMHYDKPPVKWKMNWPVLNMTPTCIRFFEPLDENNVVITRTGDPNSKAFDNYELKPEQFRETHRYRFEKKPLVMNGQIAHDIAWEVEGEWPRIGLQIMFVKEPIHLL